MSAGCYFCGAEEARSFHRDAEPDWAGAPGVGVLLPVCAACDLPEKLARVSTMRPIGAELTRRLLMTNALYLMRGDSAPAWAILAVEAITATAWALGEGKVSPELLAALSTDICAQNALVASERIGGDHFARLEVLRNYELIQ